MTAADRLLELLSNRFGLSPQESYREKLDAFLRTLSKEKKTPPDLLVTHAQHNSALLREMAGCVTVGESYFYRHPAHLPLLTDALKERLRNRQSYAPVTIWSAGCADGQEAYSIAIACMEQLTEEERAQVRILATDLNPDAIERAKQGNYYEWSFRGLTHERRAIYFRRTADGVYQLKADIKNMVCFDCLSVQEQAARFEAHSLDFIFFRNVVIYLKPDAQTDIYTRFWEILRPDGFFFTAPSDTRPPQHLFQWSDNVSTSVYQPVSEEKVEKENHAAKAMTTRALQFSFPKRTFPAAPFEETRSEDSLPATAVSSSSDVKAQAPIANSEQHRFYIERGKQYLERDQSTLAVDDFRRAVFLEPTDAVARFWYSVSLQRNGAPNRSLMQIHHLVSMLSNMPTDTLLSDGRTTASELLSAVMQLNERLI